MKYFALYINTYKEFKTILFIKPLKQQTKKLLLYNSWIDNHGLNMVIYNIKRVFKKYFLVERSNVEWFQWYLYKGEM